MADMVYRAQCKNRKCGRTTAWIAVTKGIPRFCPWCKSRTRIQAARLADIQREQAQ